VKIWIKGGFKGFGQQSQVNLAKINNRCGKF